MGTICARRVAAFLCVGVLVTACAGDGDESVPAPSDVPVTAEGELFTEVGSDDSPTAAADPDAMEPVIESIPPVAETGVPGIDCDDAFCRVWSRYAGSVQALSLAWAVQPPVAAVMLSRSRHRAWCRPPSLRWQPSCRRRSSRRPATP